MEFFLVLPSTTPNYLHSSLTSRPTKVAFVHKVSAMTSSPTPLIMFEASPRYLTSVVSMMDLMEFIP